MQHLIHLLSSTLTQTEVYDIIYQPYAITTAVAFFPSHHVCIGKDKGQMLQIVVANIPTPFLEDFTSTTTITL